MEYAQRDLALNVVRGVEHKNLSLDAKFIIYIQHGYMSAKQNKAVCLSTISHSVYKVNPWIVLTY